ncbi:phospholipase B1, membrane-associated [Eurytemora carolleeae]|uniref:phospholipase B1, membrane-associated n=1 Tax=Eurytemora carolleeae TaxID=1294199 RepID=UPI000C775EF8|nr:phospholipase B1, membrane-associated [Eurytemora carolleeae]|eukprot:XP_023338111.1 phospholipase B1, membrane-associated-like [Eurytemora affinis]
MRVHSPSTSISLVKFQRLIEQAGFPCEPEGNYSYNSVRTVHQVRPQDIGIIGALGDSLTAGTGAKAKNILEVLDENRGVSFTTGGEGDWKSSPTLANFIRVFNPNLKGASYGNTRAVMIPFEESAGGIKGLNLSKSGSQAKDLPEMARHLVHMVQRIPNWENEWKLFTILIGICYFINI